MSKRINYPDKLTFAEGVGQWMIEKLKEGIKKKGLVNIAVSGGTTPLPVFQYLSAQASELDWSLVRWFWVDERCVGPNHPDSNFRMAFEAILEKIPSFYSRMRGELSPQEGADLYQQILAWLLPLHNGVPSFDLLLLGVGTDGHTASLFPSQSACNESDAWVVSTINPNNHSHRITLTFPVLNNACNRIIAFGGKKKKEIVTSIFLKNTKNYPVAYLMNAQSDDVWISYDTD